MEVEEIFNKMNGHLFTPFFLIFVKVHPKKWHFYDHYGKTRKSLGIPCINMKIFEKILFENG